MQKLVCLLDKMNPFQNERALEDASKFPLLFQAKEWIVGEQ